MCFNRGNAASIKSVDFSASFVFLSASKSTLIITLYRFGLYKTIGLTGTDHFMFRTV